MKNKNRLSITFFFLLGVILTLKAQSPKNLEQVYKESVAAESKAMRELENYAHIVADKPVGIVELRNELRELELKDESMKNEALKKRESDSSYIATLKEEAKLENRKVELQRMKEAASDKELGEVSKRLRELAKIKDNLLYKYYPISFSEVNEVRLKIRNLSDMIFNEAMSYPEGAPELIANYETATKAVLKAKRELAKSQGKVLAEDFLENYSPKPVFKEGTKLYPLTRYGWTEPFSQQSLMARDWGYCLQFNYLTNNAVELVNNPFSEEHKKVALVKSNPKKYKLAVTCDRYTPAKWSDDIWCQDANGNFLDSDARSMDGTSWGQNKNKTYRLTTPESYWIELGKGRARPLVRLNSMVPITIVLNGGEYGLGVWGFAGKAWEADPKDAAFLIDQEKKGIDKYDAAFLQKVRSEELCSNEIKKAVPDRLLYNHYITSGSTHKGINPEIYKWGDGKTVGRYKNEKGKYGDIPNNQHYVGKAAFNSGFVGKNDLLTQSLNAIGEQIALGDKLAYSWYWLDEKNVDPDYTLYCGFIKCTYLTGVIGGNAGTYNTPDFEAPFDPKTPPNYLNEEMSLAKVHALFTHLDEFIFNSDLIDDGKYRHYWSPNQPSYEFLPEELSNAVEEKTFQGEKVLTLTPGRPVRVLARKHNHRNEWLVEVWAADGKTQPATITIPGLGRLKLKARKGGNTYLITLKNANPTIKLLDPNEQDPTESYRKS